MKFLASASFIAFIFSSCSTTTYYLVRHAEKADDGSDPVLSTAGIARANALKDSLASKKIKSIYVTNYQRTQQTASSLASAIKITPIVLNAGSTSVLVDALQKIKGNRSVLIVGHSNTIPVVIDSLMKVPQGITIAENDFDNFFALTIKRALFSKRKLKSTTYGKSSP
jgi:broad specificity phosphatase PhoE